MAMWQDPRTVILGAYGYTGALVAGTFAGCGIPFTGAGRDAQKTAEALSAVAPGAPSLTIDIEKPVEVQALLDRFNVIVNCVGPFSIFSRALVEAAAHREGVLYIDVCGEQDFVRTSHDNLHDLCRRNGNLFVHACAYESAFVDVLAREICDPDKRYRDISSYYAGSSAYRISPGTLLTLRILPHLRTERWANGAWQSHAPGSPAHELTIETPPISGMAVFTPYPEIQFFVEAFAPQNACSYHLLEAEAARFMGRPPAGGTMSVDDIVARHRRRQHSGPDAEERRSQAFHAIVQATDEDGATRTAVASGHDTYGATAHAVRLVWEHVVSAGASPGVKGPGSVIPPAKFLSRMSELYGVEVNIL